MREIIRRILKFILNIFVHIVYRVKIVGKENIPSEGAAILCENHVHGLDVVVIVLTAKREINGLAKKELFRIGILRWLAKTFGIYAVKRDGSDIGALKISLKILKDNGLLIIAPEGTRNGMAKGLKPKNGPVSLAIKAGVPIIPIGVNGNFKAFSKVTLNIGKPIHYDIDAADKTDLDNLTKELMNEIIKLRDVKI